MAVFTTVVVLPSPGCPLLTRIVFGGLFTGDSSTDVLSTLYASATEERPSSVNSLSVCSPLPDEILSPSTAFFFPLLDDSKRDLRPLIAGITLRAGSCV